MDDDDFKSLFGKSKGDIKDFVPKPAWPGALPYTVYTTQPTAKPLCLIEGLLDAGGRILVGGSSKTFKTWLILDLCLSQTSGTEFLGTFQCHPYPVLYVNFELKDYYLKSRISRIAEAKGLSLSCLAEFFIWDLRGLDFWTLDGFIAELLAIVERHAIKLVVIDPYYKLLTRAQDENSQTDMASTLRQFNPLNTLGASILYAMHFSKGNQAAKNPEDRISGAGSTIRDCDGLITLTAHEESLAFVADFILRDFAPLESFVLKWQFPLLERTDLDPKKLKGQAGRKEAFPISEVLSLISDHDNALSYMELKDLVCSQTGMSKSSFIEKMRLLKVQGKISTNRATGFIRLL